MVLTRSKKRPSPKAPVWMFELLDKFEMKRCWIKEYKHGISALSVLGSSTYISSGLLPYIRLPRLWYLISTCDGAFLSCVSTTLIIDLHWSAWYLALLAVTVTVKFTLLLQVQLTEVVFYLCRSLLWSYSLVPVLYLGVSLWNTIWYSFYSTLQTLCMYCSSFQSSI